MVAAVDSRVNASQSSEDIPDDAILYMRVHKVWWSKKKKRFGADAFRDSGEGAQKGMSTNWSKYASAEQTREEATSSAGDNYVVAMKAGDIRRIPGLTITFSPLPDLPGHTDVIGEKTLEVKDALRGICETVLKSDED